MVRLIPSDWRTGSKSSTEAYTDFVPQGHIVSVEDEIGTHISLLLSHRLGLEVQRSSTDHSAF